jgi:lipid II isoglutaminyl synthase (glutamine-hydrolysing)
VPDLVLVSLYPDLLRTYGDRGNVLTLQHRAEWRGFDVRVEEVSRGDRLPPGADIALIGGGTDRVQFLVGRDLQDRATELVDAAAAGCVILGVCGGYQLLGRTYTAADGTAIEGLGMLDVTTTAAASGRIVGRVRERAALWNGAFELFGFENHGGRTHVGPAASPLATTSKGRGNNGTDRTEGAVQGSVVGTYLHGPVLPVNPPFADALLERALGSLTGGGPLPPLDDGVEDTARREAQHRKR